MPSTVRTSGVNSYLIAVAAVAGSVALRYALDPFLGDTVPYALSFIAVVAVAFTGELGAALLATIGAALVANFLFVSPRLTLAVTRTSDGIALAVFLISGVLISVLAHRLRKQQRALAVIADSAETHRRELQEERTRLQNLVSSIPGVVWEAWGEPGVPTQRIGFVSKYAEKMLGYKVDEWLSTPNFWLNIVAPEDRDKAAAIATQKFSDAEAGGNEFRWMTKDGRRLWVIAQSTTVTDDKGRAIGMRGVTFDITPRKEAELRVELLAGISAESPADATYEQLGQGIARRTSEVVGECCILRIEDNGDLRPIAAAHQSPEVLPLVQAVLSLPQLASNSPFFRDMLASPRTMKFDDVASVLKGDLDIPAVRQLMERFPVCAGLLVPMLSHGRLVGTMSLWRSAKGPYGDSEVRLVEAIAARAALLFENRRLFETAQRDAAEARRAREEAERANQVKDEFLATLSHELRTPLNAILGWAHMLRDPRMPEDRRQSAVDTIVRNAQSQEQLISDILDVQRIMAGKLRLNLRTVDLGNVVRAAAETVRPAADAKRIRLQLLLDLDAPAVPGDAERLQQVVWNLLSNAIKFTPTGGRVEVRLLREGEDCELIVEDTGPGISAEFLPYVFDRFRQADSSTTRTHRGLGLGLSIVRSLIEMHGGTIQANNVSGPERTGAMFTIRLPRQGVRSGDFDGRADPTMDEGTRMADAAMLSDVTVLVVEDDPDARELVAAVLQRCGARVETVASVAEAMDSFRQHVPDVLVSDIEMPGEDGYSFIRRIRELSAEKGGRVPAAALTAYASAADRMKVLSAGYNIHLAKPVQPAELAVVVANLAGRTVARSS